MNQRQTNLKEILYTINLNGGKVPLLQFISKMQFVLGVRELKVIEYVQLLEAIGDLKRSSKDNLEYLETTDKSRVRILKVVQKKPESNEEYEREVDEFLDKFK